MRAFLFRSVGPAFLSVLASCGGSASNRGNELATSDEPTPNQIASAMTLLVEEQCEGCHDIGNEDIPQFSAAAMPDKALALRTAIVVASGAMPPTTRLNAEQRHTFISGMCQRFASDAAKCKSALTYSPPLAVRGAPHIQRLVQKRIPKLGEQPEESWKGQDAFAAEIHRSNRSFFLTPSRIVRLLLLAEHWCGDGSKVDDHDLAYRRCFESIINFDLIRTPDFERQGHE